MTKRIPDATSIKSHMNSETNHQHKRHVQCDSITSVSKKIRDECGVIDDEKNIGEECGVEKKIREECSVNNGDDAPVVGSGKVVSVDSCAAVDKAANVLRKKGVIAIPTDTIYGICCKVEDDEAIKRIYKIKGREFSKPLAICVADVQDIPKCVDVGRWSDVLPKLLPGGVTIVLPRKPSLNPKLNPDFRTVGVRIPDHTFVQELCAALGKPIALTSANRSNGPNSSVVQDFEDLWRDIDLVVDGGTLLSDVGSTVVELNESEYRVIRKGRDHDKTVQVLSEELIK